MGIRGDVTLGAVAGQCMRACMSARHMCLSELSGYAYMRPARVAAREFDKLEQSV